MTTDIVERLRARTFRPIADFVRAFHEQGNLTNGDAALHEEAAAEIERLRAEVGALRRESVALLTDVRAGLQDIMDNGTPEVASLYIGAIDGALQEHTNGR